MSFSTEKPADSVLAAGEAPPEHKPYVPDAVIMPEFTWGPLLLGTVLGIIFGASSLYLLLKVGMTVSASVPIAVLSITLFRAFSRWFNIRQATILENNIVQTAGSAGESMAFGVGVTMPALLLIGFEMHWVNVMTVAVLGGLLGMLLMIPLRRAFIVKQHGKLKYPEGTACAEVLVAGEKGGASARMVFIGFGIAFVHKLLTKGLQAVGGRAGAKPVHRRGCGQGRPEGAARRRRAVAGNARRRLPDRPAHRLHDDGRGRAVVLRHRPLIATFGGG